MKKTMNKLNQVNEMLKRFDGKIIKSIELHDNLGQKKLFILFTDNQRLQISSDIEQESPIQHTYLIHYRRPTDNTGNIISFTDRD